MNPFGPRYSRPKRDPLAGAQVGVRRNAPAEHIIAVRRTDTGRHRAECSCRTWIAERSRTDPKAAIADGTAHVKRATREAS